MKMIGASIGIVLIAICGYWAVRFFSAVHVSKELIGTAVPFEQETTDYSVTMLVLGDSTAVGVGAHTAQESVPGRVATSISATYVENYAVSGAVVGNVSEEIAHAKRAHYNLILIQIGANDITRFHPAAGTAESLARILETLPSADRIIVISAGDVGTATLFPPPLKPFYTHLNMKYHAAFVDALTPLGITYVNLYTAPDSELFKKEPKIYLAADGFHPSSAGYAIWFNAIKPYLTK